MLIVDTHAHAGTSWFEPVESLVFQMDRNEVDKAVLVQHRGVYDNTYLFGCVARYPGRFAVAAMVDTAQDDASATLERSAEAGAVAVRLSPMQRSPGDDPLAIWRKAAELGLAVTSLGEVDEFVRVGRVQQRRAQPTGADHSHRTPCRDASRPGAAVRGIQEGHWTSRATRIPTSRSAASARSANGLRCCGLSTDSTTRLR